MAVVNDSMEAVGRNAPGKRSFLNSFFSSVSGPGFTVTYWDGVRKTYGKGSPEFEINFRKEPRLLDLFSSPSFFFGEGYMRGDIDLAGSYIAIARVLASLTREGGGVLKRRIIAGTALRAFSAARSLSQQKQDIAAHYDLGNDFFALWLDKLTQSYSCAYFRDARDSLDAAQQDKIDLVLRKLCLKPGMRLLDVGCGWGGLAVCAARQYGARVLAVTLSEEQAVALRRRFKEEKLTGSCEVRLCNYLELDHGEPFDRVVSVGMFEHVGKERYRDYFAKVRNLLRSGGVSLLHTLTKNRPTGSDPWIAKHIFPGGRIPTVSEVVSLLPEDDFYLLHAESLRRHYVRTLNMWHENFSRPEVLDKVGGMFGQAFVRMWSLYLRMASAFLAIGELDVHQFVFTKGINDDLPMTLESVYAER